MIGRMVATCRVFSDSRHRGGTIENLLGSRPQNLSVKDREQFPLCASRKGKQTAAPSDQMPNPASLQTRVVMNECPGQLPHHLRIRCSTPWLTGWRKRRRRRRERNNAKAVSNGPRSPPHQETCQHQQEPHRAGPHRRDQHRQRRRENTKTARRTLVAHEQLHRSRRERRHHKKRQIRRCESKLDFEGGGRCSRRSAKTRSTRSFNPGAPRRSRVEGHGRWGDGAGRK